MSRHTAVPEESLSRFDFRAALDPARQAATRHWAEFAVRLFQPLQPRKVVAFAAANPGEGVTHAIRGLAAELARAGKRVAILDGALRPIAGAAAAPESISSILGAEHLNLPGIRDDHDCILLDCGSLHSSIDVLRLAPSVDGVVLIVEAGRTSTDQVERAAQMIRDAQGTLLGLVLNKRRYPIPAWLYRLL